ncbi:MAG: zinc finger MYND domain-containing protein [Promethearchaeota archaeon]
MTEKGMKKDWINKCLLDTKFVHKNYSADEIVKYEGKLHVLVQAHPKYKLSIFVTFINWTDFSPDNGDEPLEWLLDTFAAYPKDSAVRLSTTQMGALKGRNGEWRRSYFSIWMNVFDALKAVFPDTKRIVTLCLPSTMDNHQKRAYVALCKQKYAFYCKMGKKEETKTKFQAVCRKCHHICSTPKRCVKCHVAYYCSKKCQKLDWKRHRTVCCCVHPCLHAPTKAKYDEGIGPEVSIALKYGMVKMEDGKFKVIAE